MFSRERTSSASPGKAGVSAASLFRRATSHSSSAGGTAAVRQAPLTRPTVRASRAASAGSRVGRTNVKVSPVTGPAACAVTASHAERPSGRPRSSTYPSGRRPRSSPSRSRTRSRGMGAEAAGRAGALTRVRSKRARRGFMSAGTPPPGRAFRAASQPRRVTPSVVSSGPYSSGRRSRKKPMPARNLRASARFRACSSGPSSVSPNSATSSPV